MSKYGLPYMGSKSKICEDIIRLFPKADHFYDVFGGGFSITNAMIVNRFNDYKEFHFNELRTGICELIQDAIAGKYSYENFVPPWVSREEFHAKKETDVYIKICWSFGNNGEGYLFGEDREPYKKSMHQAVVFNEFDDLAKQVFGMDKFKDGYSVNDRRLFLRNRALQVKDGDRLERLKQLEQLEQLERLQQLERLPLDKLNFHNTSYENITIKDNSIIYCDPPYANTADYGNSFNTNKFLDWAHEQKNPVFISEYDISDKRFKMIFKIKKRSMLNKDKSMTVFKEEKVYVNKAGLKCLINQ